MTTRNRAFFRLALAGLFAGIYSGTAFAEIIEVAPAADTSLRSGPEADWNSGANVELTVGTSTQGSPQNHALLRFDMPEIPTNAQLESVSLRFVVTTFNHPSVTYSLHRLLVEWGEGSNPFRGPANTGEATWNSRLHGIQAWSEPGAGAGTDYAEEPSALPILSTGTNEFTFDGLKADVEFWLQNPQANFGWILRPSTNGVSTGKKLAAREEGSQGPRLIIEYKIPETPAPPVLSAPRLVGNEIHFTFDALANKSYAVEFREFLSSGAWEVLTNLPPQSEDMSIEVIDMLDATERYYRARIY